MIGDGGPEHHQCSRAGCTETAEWNLNWRNPRIHGPDRVKVWPACGAHLDYLRDYLEARKFPLVTTPAGEIAPSLPDVGSPAP